MWGAVLNALSKLQLDRFKDGLNKFQAVNTCVLRFSTTFLEHLLYKQHR